MTDCTPVRERWPDLAAMLAAAEDAGRTSSLRRAESIGRPIGSAAWVTGLEQDSGRT